MFIVYLSGPFPAKAIGTFVSMFTLTTFEKMCVKWTHIQADTQYNIPRAIIMM